LGIHYTQDCNLAARPLVGHNNPTIWTRNSAIADKPRDAFKCQSRSPTMVPFHILGMVSYCVCYSNFVPKTHHFLRYSTSKMPWPWKPG